MSGIMENAVGGLIASEAHGIIAQLLSRIGEEIILGWGFTKELEDLQSQLTTLSVLLQGASFQSNKNSLIGDWVNKVKDAAYAADDFLDECSYEALKRSSLTRKAKDKFKDRVSSPFSRHHMARRVRDLRKLIGIIYCDAKILGLKPIKVAIGDYCTSSNHGEVEDRIQQNRRKWVDDQFLIGRDEDITRLIKLLCHPSNNTRDLTVIGIVGLAGLGKTTLSKRVAKAQEVMECFNFHVIWLVVSHSFDQTDVLKKMVELLYGEATNLSDSLAIVKKLREKLNGKRYLLVLDDVWETFDWEPFRCALQDIGGSKGTCILVTSRGKNVVAKMGTYDCDNHEERDIKRASVYQLQGLNEDNSWSLFMARMRGGNLVAVGERYVIAKRMIKKCCGVPLAIKALADLLRDQNIQRWRDIEKSHVWQKDDKFGILPSLKLSFYYLPNTNLKRCFSYCAIFGEDEVIEEEKLIQLWMAQGFLQPCDRMELIGKEYLYILLNSSLFQEAEFDELGNVETFKIHDLVLSLARVVSSDDAEFLNLEEKIIVLDDDTSRELQHHRSTRLFREDPTATFYNKFRTYYYHPQSFYQRVNKSLIFVRPSKNLRVLCLCNLGLKDLPESVGCLKHLRYLDISGNEFGTLPNVITKMFHLQTLRILSNGTMYGSKHFPIILTKEVGNLVNLRHICAGKYQEIGIPVGLSHLRALQTIPIVNLREDWGGRLSDLGSMNNIKGTLKIQGLECINSVKEARSLNLGRKLHVDRLILKWSPVKHQITYHMNEILEAFQPHENLSMLEVAFYGGTSVPWWLMEMTAVGGSPLYNLVSLKLSHFTYAEGDLNLENLRCLRFLSIKHCHWLNISFPKHGFQCCKHLEVLVVNGGKIDHLPDLSPLTQLRVLGMTSCKGRRRNRLELAGLASLPCLTSLCTDELLPTDLGKDSPLCSSLQSLDLACREFLCDDKGMLPVKLQHLVALHSLRISEFECLEMLPEWLGELTCLKSLMLDSLPKLKRLASQSAMQRLSSLQFLQVRECPFLEEQFSTKNGEFFKATRILDVSWLNTQRHASSSVERSFLQGKLNVISENNVRFRFSI